MVCLSRTFIWDTFDSPDDYDDSPLTAASPTLDYTSELCTAHALALHLERNDDVSLRPLTNEFSVVLEFHDVTSHIVSDSRKVFLSDFLPTRSSCTTNRIDGELQLADSTISCGSNFAKLRPLGRLAIAQ